MEFYGSCHNHTDRSNFRLRDSTNRLEELCWYAADELKHNFIAITDHETIATAIDCQKVEKKIREKYPDFKIIRGNEIYLCRNGLNGSNYKRKEDRFWHWILLAKDAEGHKQIREISTRAWSHCFKTGKMIRVPTYYQDLIDVIGSNPGHVIMSTACFRQNTPVLTRKGYKNIQDITNQDYILNMYGDWEKVNFPTSREYQGKGCKITFTENKEEPIICTEDHQFLVAKSDAIARYNKNKKTIPFKWKKAKELNAQGKKDIAFFPIKISYTGKNIIEKTEWEGVIPTCSEKKPLPSQIIITPEVMRLFGLFLGDGHTNFNPKKHIYRVGFTFNEDEFPVYWDSFVKKASDDLGICFNILKRPEHHRIDLSTASVDAFKLFYYLFQNKKANTKTIPSRLLNISQELNYELFFGYALADGYFRNKKTGKYNQGEMITASISFQLTKDFQDLLKNQGIRASIYSTSEKTDKNNIHHQTAYYLTSSNNGWRDIDKKQNISHEEVIEIFNRCRQHCKSRYVEINGVLYKKVYIQSIESIEINERVYCLNVNSHSFCCNNIIVHNCLGSKLSQLNLDYSKNPTEEKYKYIKQWIYHISDICGRENFFLEVQPSFNKEQIAVNKVYKQLSEELNIPVIITLDAHYLKKEDEPIHHAFLTAQQGDRETSEFYASTYMMSREEIHSYMDKTIGVDTVSIWMNNTKIIYDMCEDYDLMKPLHIPYLPLTIDKITEEDFNEYKDKIKELEYFFKSEYQSDRDMAAALIKKIKSDKEQYDNDRTFKMMDDNLAAVRISSDKQNTRWSAYLLNMRDYIKVIWEKGDSLVGCGRGSGGGFLLLNMLDIIQINPLREKAPLRSWRFLNPERASVLDIDTDIEGGKRPQVYKALQDTYGADRVSKVLTIRTEKTKSAILTAARGLGLDPDEGNYLASFIKSDRGQQRTLEQTYYGDEENDIKPDLKFRELMDGKYHNVWKVANFISGLCCGVGSHAGGVIFYDEPIINSTALMQTTNGDIVTQFDLHTCEGVSLIKIDLLSIEALDKMRACLDLLTEYGYIDKNLSLRERYEKTIGVYNIDRTSPEMWHMIHEHKIESLFQMEQQSGIKGIAATKPTTLEELATLNSVIRLMAQEKGAEQPIDKFARFKSNINNWYNEMKAYKLTDEQQKLLEPILLDSSGICESQEKFMSLVQMPEAGGFSLAWSDRLRKSIAKKNPAEFDKLQEEYYATVKEKGLDMNFCNYIWKVLVCTSKGYGFNLSHTLAYSIIALQEMNLAYKYPIIFWDIANLIVDSGSMNLTDKILEEDENEIVEDTEEKEEEYDESFFDEEDYNDEDNEEEKKKKKLKNSSTAYGKIAAAIGKMKARGLKFSLPDINHSTITFSPNLENNTILYGLRGITRVGNQFIKEIFNNRPYTDIFDFIEKTKPKKPQVISLIKAGAFDNLYKDKTRQDIMKEYLLSVSDQKKRITLQNMQMLATKNLIPKELEFQQKIFFFNKYLKRKGNRDDKYYFIDTIAHNFYIEHFDTEHLQDLVINGNEITAKISQTIWDKIYDNAMNPIRKWMKENQADILKQLNDTLYKETYEKYAEGSISKWEMDSLSFYYHEHELANLKTEVYDIDNYEKLENDEIDRTFTDAKTQTEICLYKIHRIAGTVIDKNKDKGIVTLLTPSGVVTVKIWKNQFTVWDKQISERGADGKKHVKEKSWFTRGNKLIITGIKRDDAFIPKKYKNTSYPLFEKINAIDEKGFIINSSTERAEASA